MSRWLDLEGVAVDEEGFYLNTPRLFETVKEAKDWLREVSGDRRYWVQLAESETFPDEIHSIQLVRGDNVVSVKSPSWKGAQS